MRDGALEPCHMPIENFHRFQQVVYSDPALLESLRQAPSLPALISQVLTLGQEGGYDFSEQDVQAVLNANRRAWLERWLDE